MLVHQSSGARRRQELGHLGAVLWGQPVFQDAINMTCHATDWHHACTLCHVPHDARMKVTVGMDVRTVVISEERLRAGHSSSDVTGLDSPLPLPN